MVRTRNLGLFLATKREVVVGVGGGRWLFVAPPLEELASVICSNWRQERRMNDDTSVHLFGPSKSIKNHPDVSWLKPQKGTVKHH